MNATIEFYIVSFGMHAKIIAKINFRIQEIYDQFIEENCFFETQIKRFAEIFLIFKFIIESEIVLLQLIEMNNG